MKYPPYPRYKNSTFDCYGQVPANWFVMRIDRLFTQRNEEPLPDDKLVSAFITGEVTLRDNKSGNIIKSSGYEIGYKRIHKGDLVISGMNAHLGGLGISDSNGKGSPVNLVLKPVVDLERNYYSYLLRHLAKSQFIKSLVNTIRFNSSDFKSQDLKSIFVLVPTLTEQKAIAEFLDTETLKIDELIGKQERLIELLQEKRQSLITHAVTKGLNPHAPHKDSGIAWLGEIPEHWECWQVRHLISTITSGSRGWADYYSDEGDIFVRIGNLTRDKIIVDVSDLKYVALSATAKEGTRAKICPDDILVSITADLGSVAVASKEIEGGYVSQHIALLKPIRKHIWSQFFGYAILAEPCKIQLQIAAYGGTKIQLSLDDVKELRIFLPPIDEQKEIADYLDRETAKIDALMEKARKAIELLQEHRTALISAAVTGKIDVRNNSHGNLPNH